MESLLSGLPNVCVYIDDILVSGTTEEDHLHNLDSVLTRLESAGLTLKKSKCTFRASSVEYLGHVIDAQGLHPAISKIKAISQAPAPSNTTKLKSFLGLLNYYHKFLPNLSDKWTPGTIIAITGPLSYHVKKQDGSILRRHVDQLRPRYCSIDRPPDSHSDDFEDFPLMPEALPPAPSPVPPPVIRRSTRPHRPVDRFEPTMYFSS